MKLVGNEDLFGHLAVHHRGGDIDKDEIIARISLRFDQGVGVAVLPETCIRPEHRIVTRPFANMTPQRKVGLAYPKDSELPGCFNHAVC